MTGRPLQIRVRTSQIAWADSRLSDRDRAIIEAVARLRLMTGLQIERACFPGLHGRSRAVVRGRALARLVAWRVLLTVDRRVGGPAGGSSSTVYALDSVGAALATTDRHRMRAAPGDRFRAHTLAVAELYAQLVEQIEATPRYKLAAFDGEPASWSSDGIGGYLKPDAYLQLETSAEQLHWWIEVDRATESLPTIERKLRTYLAFVDRGQLGPSQVIPRVLITVPSEPRGSPIRALCARLPAPASQLFTVEEHDRAATALLTDLA